MKRELYRRWLDDSRGLTLSEFVAERRGELRQQRAQRRMNAIYGPMLQNAAQDSMLRNLAAMQGATAIGQPIYVPQGLGRGIFGGLFG